MTNFSTGKFKISFLCETIPTTGLPKTSGYEVELWKDGASLYYTVYKWLSDVMTVQSTGVCTPTSNVGRIYLFYYGGGSDICITFKEPAPEGVLGALPTFTTIYYGDLSYTATNTWLKTIAFQLSGNSTGNNSIKISNFKMEPDILIEGNKYVDNSFNEHMWSHNTSLNGEINTDEHMGVFGADGTATIYSSTVVGADIPSISLGESKIERLCGNKSLYVNSFHAKVTLGGDYYNTTYSTHYINFRWSGDTESYSKGVRFEIYRYRVLIDGVYEIRLKVIVVMYYRGAAYASQGWYNCYDQEDIDFDVSLAENYEGAPYKYTMTASSNLISATTGNTVEDMIRTDCDGIYYPPKLEEVSFHVTSDYTDRTNSMWIKEFSTDTNPLVYTIPNVYTDKVWYLDDIGNVEKYTKRQEEVNEYDYKLANGSQNINNQYRDSFIYDYSYIEDSDEVLDILKAFKEHNQIVLEKGTLFSDPVMFKEIGWNYIKDKYLNKKAQLSFTSTELNDTIEGDLANRIDTILTERRLTLEPGSSITYMTYRDSTDDDRKIGIYATFTGEDTLTVQKSSSYTLYPTVSRYINNNSTGEISIVNNGEFDVIIDNLIIWRE